MPSNIRHECRIFAYKIKAVKPLSESPTLEPLAGDYLVTLRHSRRKKLAGRVAKMPFHVEILGLQEPTDFRFKKPKRHTERMIKVNKRLSERLADSHAAYVQIAW